MPVVPVMIVIALLILAAASAVAGTMILAGLGYALVVLAVFCLFFAFLMSAGLRG